MRFAELRRRRSEVINIEPQGNALALLAAIKHIPHSKAIDYFETVLRDGRQNCVYERLSTVAALINFARDKRTYLDAEDRFNVPAVEMSELRGKFAQKFNCPLAPMDVRTSIDQALFLLVHPRKKR